MWYGSLSESMTSHILIFIKLMGYSSLRMTAATGQMARDAREDSEIMKTITVVTMIYLPATFAAVT